MLSSHAATGDRVYRSGKVQGTSALFAALQVPRLLADEATIVLWREGSPSQALIPVRHAQRVNITPIRVRP